MLTNPWNEFKTDVVRTLEAALVHLGWESPKKIEETLTKPPDPRLGDLATTICFELAKTFHKSPTWLAAELANAIKPAGLIERIEVMNNYLNFFVDVPKLATITLQTIESSDDDYGCIDVGEGKKVVVEHTSINPTKPLHIGHGRNAVIGDTIARILRALGYSVEVQNYIDDMGRQVAETLLAYQLVKKPRAKFDHLLGFIYADMHRRLECEPELEQRVREILVQLEHGGGRLVTITKRLSERCVKANLETTDRLGISYDLLVWESDIVKSGMLKEIIERIRATPYAIDGMGEHAGTLLLKLTDFGFDNKVLVRSDGTAVYTARDIAYQLWKFGRSKTKLIFKFHSRRPSGIRTYTTAKKGKTIARFGKADKVINVVGVEQRFPQQVVFTALKILGLMREYENSHHLAYEHVWLPTGRFSGRKGTWVGFSVDDVLEEAVTRAEAIVREHAPKASELFKKKAAEVVGVGAVRYSLLSTSPEKKIVFRWEDSLNFDRNSGPAIQYSHARACSILRKAKRGGWKCSSDVFKLSQEHNLIKVLAKFPEVVREAGEKLQPNILALSAAEIALMFNKFYEVAPVIDAETEELRFARLRLVNCVRIVLRNALNLMGITAPEKM